MSSLKAIVSFLLVATSAIEGSVVPAAVPITYARVVPQNIPPFASSISIYNGFPRGIIAPASALLPPHVHAVPALHRHAAPVHPVGLVPHVHAAAPIVPHVHAAAPVVPHVHAAAVPHVHAAPIVPHIHGAPFVPHVHTRVVPHVHATPIVPHVHAAPIVPHIHPASIVPQFHPAPVLRTAPVVPHIHTAPVLPHVHAHAAFVPKLIPGLLG